MTITKERYVVILEKFWDELKSLYPSLMNRFWFQQDGATPHTSILPREWLKNHFGNRLISLRTDFEWAPNSPDLSPPDFYLWGYLKDCVYENEPNTITELKEAIREKIKTIPRDVYARVMNNFVQRLKKCTELEGDHMEQVL